MSNDNYIPDSEAMSVDLHLKVIRVLHLKLTRLRWPDYGLT